MENAKIEVNANFHVLKKDPAQKADPRYLEYRRRWKEWPENSYAGRFPLFIDVEAASACNLQCPFCATTYRSDLIDKGCISFELVKKIIDEGAEKGLYGVKLSYRGEPLLNKDICKFVAYAKSRGLIDVYFNTNAMLLTKEVSEALIDAGLDRISISVEGFTKEVYEGYRVGARFETVLANIKGLQQEKKKRGTRHPRVRAQTVMLPELKEKMGEYEAFWSRFADEVAYLDYKDMKEKRRGLQYRWACPQIWQRMAIWWDGTILPCNHDDDGELNLVNANEISIEEAWNSNFLNTVRQRHKSGMAHEIPGCDGCYLRDSEIRKLMDKGGA